MQSGNLITSTSVTINVSWSCFSHCMLSCCVFNDYLFYSFSFTCDGVLAAAAFLRHTVPVALDTEDLVLVVGETWPRQRLRAGAAHKTVAVPGLVLVVYSSRDDGLETGTRAELRIALIQFYKVKITWHERHAAPQRTKDTIWKQTPVSPCICSPCWRVT